MEKRKLSDEKYLKLIFNDGKLLLVDVSGDDWEEILKQKNKIIRIITDEWSWNPLTNEVTFN